MSLTMTLDRTSPDYEKWEATLRASLAEPGDDGAPVPATPHRKIFDQLLAGDATIQGGLSVHGRGVLTAVVALSRSIAATAGVPNPLLMNGIAVGEEGDEWMNAVFSAAMDEPSTQRGLSARDRRIIVEALSVARAAEHVIESRDELRDLSERVLALP